MLTTVCLGTNDLARAGSFYDDVLATVGMTRLVTADTELGYGASNTDTPSVWIVRPINEQPATSGNGTQIAFQAPNPEAVDAFHAAVMKHGGSDEGAPGPRTYAPGYYGAYCRDLDGNKLHAFLIQDDA